MTCRQMGGMCDEQIKGNTSEEMIANGMKHLEEAHPEMAADINKAGPNDPMVVAWSEKFHVDFDAAPEVQE